METDAPQSESEAVKPVEPVAQPQNNSVANSPIESDSNSNSNSNPTTLVSTKAPAEVEKMDVTEKGTSVVAAEPAKEELLATTQPPTVPSSGAPQSSPHQPIIPAQQPPVAPNSFGPSIPTPTNIPPPTTTATHGPIPTGPHQQGPLPPTSQQHPAEAAIGAPVSATPPPPSHHPGPNQHHGMPPHLAPHQGKNI